MKKFLLSLAIAGATITASADTAVFYADGFNYEGDATDKVAITNIAGTDPVSCCDTPFTAAGITMTIDANGNSSIPGVYTDHVRFYQSTKMTITAPEGVTITKIYCQTVANSKGAFSVTPADAGTVSGTGVGATNPITWEGAATGTLTLDAVKQVRFSYIEVTYTGQGGTVVETSAAPEFTPASGTTFGEEGLAVTISAAAGAKIYYTIDETNPTEASNLYAAPIVLTTSATVKAIAVEEGKNASKVASATYTYKAPVSGDVEEVEFDFTSIPGVANADYVTDFEKDGVTVSFSQNGNSNGPKWYNTGKAIRMYGKNQLKVEADKTIASVTFTYDSDAYSFYTGLKNNAPVVDPGTIVENGSEGVWTVGATEGTLTAGGTSGHARIKSIKVVLMSDGPVTPTAEMPVISPASGTTFGEELTVSITAAEGATIYYTVDGTNPTRTSSVYSAPFTIAETTTIKAMAVEEGKNDSRVATATYTLVETINNLAKLIDLGLEDENTEFTYSGEAIVVYQNGANLYIQDESASLLVYGSGLPTYAAGDRITGFRGTFKNYYSTYELMAVASSFKEGVAGAPVDPLVLDLEDVTADLQNTYVMIKNVTVVKGEVDKNYTLVAVNDAELPAYDKFGIEFPTDDKEYNVIGFVNYYQAKGAESPVVQFYPIRFDSKNSVEGVEAEGLNVMVIGNNIVAPAGAQVYAINGARVAATDLAAGIYVVRVADKAVKVIVK